MPKNITRAEVVAAVNQVVELVSQWETAPVENLPMVTWRGKPRQAISEAMIEEWAALCELFETMDIEPKAQPIVLALDAFSDAVDAWAELCELSPEDADPRGSREIWSTWGDVIRSLVETAPKRLESIAQLDIEKVPERQIALIYGWVHADGAPNIQKVREERANPGKHYDADKWVHPEDARIAKETADAWAKRRSRLSDRAAVVAGPPVAYETLEDLIEQRVPSKQIADMKRIPVETVKRRAFEMGISLDGEVVRSVSSADQQQAIRDAEARHQMELDRLVAAERRALQASGSFQGEGQSGEQTGEQSQSGGESLPDRILSLAAQGRTPKEIADQLNGDHPGLTYQKVDGILRHANREPATA